MAKAKLGTGARFKELSSNVAAGYKKKGMSAEKAEEIGKATAAKIGRGKLGAKKFAALAAKGKKA